MESPKSKSAATNAPPARPRFAPIADHLAYNRHEDTIMVYGERIVIFERLRFSGAYFDKSTLMIELWNGPSKLPTTREVVIEDREKHQAIIDGLVQVQMDI